MDSHAQLTFSWGEDSATKTSNWGRVPLTPCMESSRRQGNCWTASTVQPVSDKFRFTKARNLTRLLHAVSVTNSFWATERYVRVSAKEVRVSTP